MTHLNFNIVTSIDGLAEHYGEPTERVVKYELEHVNSAGRAFIAASPFLVVATGSQRGFDCSPKGDQPGFVTVLDDARTLLIPDRRGNNKLDGLKNLIEDSRIGLIFFVPGANETYRVNGRACISVNSDLKRPFAVNGAEPTAVIIVTVQQTFHHCARALLRSSLWKAAANGRPAEVPTMGDFAAACNPATDSVAYDAAYNQRVPNELY
jgi:PPOX class probable FMN-dependent enzyme